MAPTSTAILIRRTRTHATRVSQRPRSLERTAAAGSGFPSAAVPELPAVRRALHRPENLVHEVTALVTEWLAEGRFDVAVCDFLAPAMNFPPHSTTPVLLFQHNVESALWDRQARQERHVVRRVVFSLEASKMRRYETEALGRFERVIAVSEHDPRSFSRWLRRQRSRWSPREWMFTHSALALSPRTLTLESALPGFDGLETEHRRRRMVLRGHLAARTRARAGRDFSSRRSDPELASASSRARRWRLSGACLPSRNTCIAVRSLSFHCAWAGARVSRFSRPWRAREPSFPHASRRRTRCRGRGERAPAR